MLKFAKYAFLFLILTASIVCFSDILVRAKTDAVKIIFIKGSPKIMKTDTSQWISCKLNMVIHNGDRIKTVEDEAVEISFLVDNSNIVKIDENTDVFIKKGEPPYSIELLNGSAMALIKKLPKDSAFEIRTPAGLSGARGTGWGANTDGLKVAFDAFQEHIYVKGIDKAGNEMEAELIVKSGWKTIVEKFEMPEKLEKLTNEEIDRWNKWMDELAERGGGPRREALERAGRIERQTEGAVESKRENINEARDLERIEKRLESTTSSSRANPPSS